MKKHRIQWVSIKCDVDGKLLVFIRRDNTDIAIAPGYRPSGASEGRILKIAEELTGRYQISLQFGKVIQKLDMLIMLNLPRRHEVLESS